MPEDPRKLIEYVFVFLPGFLALGFLIYVTELAVGEFAFTYLAVALSLLIYGIVSLFTRWQLRVNSTRKMFYEGLGWGRIAAASVVTVAVAVGLVLLHHSGWVVAAVHWLAPATVMKFSQHTPLPGLMSAEVRERLHVEVDQRHAAFYDNAKKSGEHFVKHKYQMYVRLHLGDGNIFEGRIIRFDTKPASDGFPVVLSPACRVVSDAKGERFQRIPGPGVYLTGKDLKFMELYERSASGCRKCFTAKDGSRINDDVCSDAGARAGAK